MRLTEPVIVNVYGDTKEQIILPSNWRAGYAEYLRNLPHDAHVQHYYFFGYYGRDQKCVTNT